MLTSAVKELHILGFVEASIVDPRRGDFHFVFALVMPCQDGASPLLSGLGPPINFIRVNLFIGNRIISKEPDALSQGIGS